jgi:hypothetical protein
MKRLSGVKINKLDFIPIKQGDLLYHEGPLLSVFKDALSDNYYFYKWSDCDDKTHRWLVFKVTFKNLKAFFDKQISIRQLILEQPFSYFLDLDNELEPVNIVLVAVANMPKSYLPEQQDSFFDVHDFENYALILQKELRERTLALA